MGLYYNPNPPHIGAQQPLEKRKNPPLSGPTPQNPPLTGPNKVPQAVYSHWTAAAYLASLLPIVAINRDPPVAGPTPQNPPIVGAYIPLAVTISWIPPPPSPIVAINLDPPISGPTPDNPPILGARVPLAVSVAWIPPPPAPIVGINLDPPIAGPTPQNPPLGGSKVRLEILNSWLPLPPKYEFPVKSVPPSAVVSAFPFPRPFPQEVLNSWFASNVSIRVPSVMIAPLIPTQVVVNVNFTNLLLMGVG